MNQAAATSRNTIAMSMLEEFERELKTTRRFIERLPEDKLSWRPHVKSMSAGQLAYHIAETPGKAVRMTVPDHEPPPDVTVREEAASLAELLTLLDDSAAIAREVLPTFDDARMRATYTIDLPDGTGFELPRARYLRTIMLNHWYHHRGQLGVYLRLLEVSVPSSYGPSGDEAGGI